MLLERNIERLWVERAVSSPERVEVDPAHPNRWRVWVRVAENDGRWLRVIYEESVHERVIITVFFDRNAARRK
jgi:hypothetical protein